MIIIFGWLKEKRPVLQVASCYCYTCQRSTDWVLLRETEWVTLFGMRTLPFLTKDFLACSRCADETPLTKPQSRSLEQGQSVADVASLLEEFQLGRKSAVQRNFLLSARAAREAESGGG